MNQRWRRQMSRLGVAVLVGGLFAAMAGAQTPKPPATSPAQVSHPAPDTSKVEAPRPADKVVLKVGDQQFTAADINLLISSLPPQTQQAIASRGKRELGDWYTRVVLLSQQARLHHLDQSPDFLHRLAIQRTLLEAQAAGEEMNKHVKTTPEEVQQYYNTHSSDYTQITLRQFIVRKRPAGQVGDPAHPNASTAQGLTPEEAKKQAEAIRQELAAGADINKIMGDFNKSGDVIIEREPRTVRRGAMRPDMEKVAFALKDGEVSEPIDVPQALVLFQVTAHDQVDLKTAAPDIEKILQQQKMQAVMDALKKKTAPWMDESYFTGASKPAEGPALPAPIVNVPPKP